MRIHTDWLLTAERAAIHEPTRTAVIADLHLGYNQARCRGGDAIPLRGVGDALAPLTRLVAAHEVRRLVIAGDLFEDRYSESLMSELLGQIERCHLELAGIIPGNHDRGLARAHHALPLYFEGMELGSWRVLHGHDLRAAKRLLLGHFHPCFSWPGAPRAPCYLVGNQRIVLPAFSEDAAGMNVLAQPRWQAYRCCVITGVEVLDFGTVGRLRRQKAQVQRRQG